MLRNEVYKLNFIIDLIAIPLGFIMKLIYGWVGNYGIAIILFTLFTKLLLLPVSYKQQKNTARMQLINPQLKKLQEKYKNDPTKMQMEQSKLYQEENINPYSSCLTSFIPLILLWGVLAVVYKPMTYIMDYDKPLVEEAKSIVLQLDPSMEKNLSKNSMRQELIIMGKLQSDPEAFKAVIDSGKVTITDKDGNQTEQKLSVIDDSFVPTVTDFAKTFVIGGTNLSETPNVNPAKNATAFLFLIPILSGLMQLAMTIYMQHMQKKRNPDMPNMGAMNGMLYFMPLFSVWLAFTVPAGVGFYWLCSSAFSFLQSVGLYAWFDDERVKKIGEAERAKAKKASRRPSMMQKMLEQQQALLAEQNGDTPQTPRLGGGPSNRVRYSDDDGEVKLSRSEQEEYNTAVIREARKRMASKYGEDEPAVNTEEPKKKKKK